MSDLSQKKCQACEGGIEPLNRNEAANLLKKIPGWRLDDDTKKITRKFMFKGFYATMSFVNAVAHIVQQQGHHPDMLVGFNYCDINFTTHAIDGLTENDFICAAKINAFLEL